MKFEVLKRSYLKRNIVIGLVVIGIISAIVLNFTRAKYRTTQSIPLVNGTINYELSDLNLIGVFIENGEDYTMVYTIPDSGYTFNNEKSYCTLNGEKDNNIKLNYDSSTKELSLTPMKVKGTKCYLYFDKELTLKDMILANNKVNSGTPDFSNIATTDEGVYKTQDDWGESYYFRGAVNNNWVKFAGFYWRIIRINGDGSIRVIYNGTSTVTIGDSTMINSSQTFNDDYNRSEYVGYMYTTNQQHGNTTNSDIKTVVDNWYSSNLASHSNKISKEAGFCGDRNLNSGSWSSQPYINIYYKIYERLYTNKSPSLKCSNSNDLYTTLSSSKGNKKLTNPIGLITADEISMAGGVYDITNKSYYLYNGANYWTMSPYHFSGAGSASVFYVWSGGGLGWDYVDIVNGVRPVINLAHDVKVTGSGTSSDPFVVT